MKTSLILLIIFVLITLFFLYKIIKRNKKKKVKINKNLPVPSTNGFYTILVTEVVTYSKEIKATSYDEALKIATDDFINDEASWREISVNTQVQ